MKNLLHTFLISFFLIFSIELNAETLSQEFTALLGNWKNSDPSTQRFTHITFENKNDQIIANTISRCAPADCELEETRLHLENGQPDRIYYVEDQYTLSIHPVLLANDVLKLEITKSYTSPVYPDIFSTALFERSN